MLLVKLVFAFVLTAILPDIVARAVHDTVLERALKVATVCPLEAPIATHFVVGPGAAVLAAIGPKVNTDAFFDAILEESVVIAAIAPYFDPLSVLFVLSCDLRSLFNRIKIVLDVKAIVLAEDAQASLPVLLPETFIDLFCGNGCSENAQATSLAIDPISFKRASVWPHKLAIAALRVLKIGI